jgi:hypothetical protein
MTTAGGQKPSPFADTVRTITAGRKFLRRKERTRTFKLGFRNDEADMKN